MYQNINSVILYSEIQLICIIILVVFMVRVFQFYKNDLGPAARTLKAAFVFTILVLSTNLVWVFLEYQPAPHIILNYIVNSLYYILASLATLCYLMYCEFEMRTKIAQQRILHFVVSIPIILMVLAVISSYKNHLFIFVNESGKYIHGKYYFILPGVLFGYLVIAAIHALIHSREITNYFNRQRDYYFAICMLPCVFLGVIESITGYPATCVGITASFVGLYILLQKLYKLQQDIIVDSLAEDFSEIIFVDMNSISFEYIRTESTEEIRSKYFRSPDFFLTLEDVINHISSEEDLEILRNSLSRSRIEYELRNHSSYYVDVRSYLHGSPEYYQIKFVRSNQDIYAKEIPGFIMAIKNMNAKVAQDMEQEKTLKDLMKRGTNYQRALYTDTLGSYEVNLTNNVVSSLVYEVVNGRKLDITERIPLPKPLAFTDFSKYYGENFVISNKEAYFETMDCENLIYQYENGYNIQEVSFRVNSPFGQRKACRLMIFLSKDEVTEEITAFIIAKDITASEQKNEEMKTNMEIIQILAREYSSVYYIDLNTEEITPYSYQEDEKVNEAGIYRKGIHFSDSYRIYVNSSVAKEDREMMLKLGSISNLRSELITKNSFTTIYRTSNMGNYIYNEMKVVRVPSEDGKINSIVIAFSNKNEQILKEQEYKRTLEEARDRAESASMAKTSFLFNMSHDIRTPLNSILGFSEMALSHKSEPEKVENYLGKVKTSGEHLLELVNFVLDMCRIESGKTTITNEPLNLEDLIHNVISITDPLMKGKNHDFKCQLAITHADVKADKLHLNEILLNILSNASKYTPYNGSITLSVSELKYNKPNMASYIFEVKDTGIGMSKEYLSHIFEPFERDRNEKTQNIQGTGLGMTITKSLIDLMGGIIAIDSAPGLGTTVSFELHFEILDSKIAEKEAVTEDDSSVASKESFGIFDTDIDTNVNTRDIDPSKIHLLVVDDQEIHRELALAVLSEVGFKVTTACDGSEALELMEESDSNEYQAILMDIMMPNMNGYLATDMIRHIADEAKAAIPIIAMTASAFEEDRKKAKDSGMNAFLTKPFNADETIRVISTVVANKLS